MGLIVRVKGVDWSGKGFPLISGFVSVDNLLGAYDFRPRANRLQDVSGRGLSAVPYRNLLNNTPLVQDSTVLQDTANGLGLIVRNGALDFKIPNRTLPIGGSVRFTTMVVGGYSGIPFDTGQPASNATICSLADMGNGVSSADFPPVIQQFATDTTLGGRLRGVNSSSNIGAVAPLGIKSCLFLTFDGTKFTYRNMTTGQVVEKTAAELGVTAGSLVPSSRAPTLVSGNYFVGNSALIGLYPELYQVAQWDKVLTIAEMDSQYQSSKLLFSDVGI